MKLNRSALRRLIESVLSEDYRVRREDIDLLPEFLKRIGESQLSDVIIDILSRQKFFKYSEEQLDLIEELLFLEGERSKILNVAGHDFGGLLQAEEFKDVDDDPEVEDMRRMQQQFFKRNFEKDPYYTGDKDKKGFRKYIAPDPDLFPTWPTKEYEEMKKHLDATAGHSRMFYDDNLQDTITLDLVDKLNSYYTQELEELAPGKRAHFVAVTSEDPVIRDELAWIKFNPSDFSDVYAYIMISTDENY